MNCRLLELTGFGRWDFSRWTLADEEYELPSALADGEYELPSALADGEYELPSALADGRLEKTNRL